MRANKKRIDLHKQARHHTIFSWWSTQHAMPRCTSYTESMKPRKTWDTCTVSAPMPYALTATPERENCTWSTKPQMILLCARAKRHLKKRTHDYTKRSVGNPITRAIQNKNESTNNALPNGLPARAKIPVKVKTTRQPSTQPYITLPKTNILTSRIKKAPTREGEREEKDTQCGHWKEPLHSQDIEPGKHSAWHDDIARLKNTLTRLSWKRENVEPAKQTK